MSTPIKGQPDFSNLDDSRLRMYRDLIDEMIGSFSDFPEESEILKRIWRYLSDECVNRISDVSEVSDVDKEVPNVARVLRRTHFLKRSTKNLIKKT